MKKRAAALPPPGKIQTVVGLSQPVPADVIVEEVAGIRRIVIHRDNTVSVLAGRDHLRLGGVSVSRRPFLEDSRVDELRFRDIQFIAHFEQDTLSSESRRMS